MTKTTTIGSKVFVNFPLQGLQSIPAKIDTGADSSAIWATQIREVDGALHFVLFGPSSPYYTGEEVISRDFTRSIIKNSFGKKERRYKVKLSVKLADRVIKAGFTLSNRSKNKFPVLIGRRTLKGKFLVDVASAPVELSKKKFLIVSAKVTDSVARFARKLEEYGDNLSVHHTDYSDFVVSFLDGRMRVTLNSTGEDLSDYDVVHFKTSKARDVTAALAHYCINRGVVVLDPIIRHFPTTSKLYEYTILSDNGIRIPNTVFIMPAALVGQFSPIVNMLGEKFVLKGIHASKGECNYLISSEAEFNKIAERSRDEDTYLVAQSFIPNKSDYRVLVLGNRIQLVIERTKGSVESHLNNTSKGGTAVLHEVDHLPESVQADSLKAARLMGRDVAGVDMMQGSEDGLWYCLEVNDGPQIASGAFVEEKQRAFAEYISKKVGK